MKTILEYVINQKIKINKNNIDPVNNEFTCDKQTTYATPSKYFAVNLYVNNERYLGTCKPSKCEHNKKRWETLWISQNDNNVWGFIWGDLDGPSHAHLSNVIAWIWTKESDYYKARLDYKRHVKPDFIFCSWENYKDKEGNKISIGII